MSTLSSFDVLPRDKSGTGPARASRRAGYVPAILYGEKKDPVCLQLEKRLVLKEMQQPGLKTRIFELKMEGKTHRAIIRALQLHPVTDMPVHIDFQRVEKTSKIHVLVPIRFLNEQKCPGIKKGGVLSVMYPQIDVVCSADRIPDHLDVDLETAEIGFALHMEELKLPAGVALAHAAHNETLAAIVPPKVVSDTEEKPAETEAEASESKE